MGAPEEELTALLAKAAALAPFDTQKEEAYMVYAVNKSNIDRLCTDYLHRAPLRPEAYEYIRDFLYYAAENRYLSEQACNEKQKHYHEIYRKAYGISTPVVELKAGRYTEYVSLTELDGVYYLPLRRALQSDDWQVSYYADEKLITAEKGAESLMLHIGQKEALCNGTPTPLSHTVANVEGTALIAVEDLERLTKLNVFDPVK